MVTFIVWSLIASAALLFGFAGFVGRVARREARTAANPAQQVIAMDIRYVALWIIVVGLALLCLALLLMNLHGMR